MSTKGEAREAEQKLLGVSADRKRGPITIAAWEAMWSGPESDEWPGALLVGDGTWPWTARIDGADIVVDNARATCFGGSGDSMDSGETASGISTAKNPTLRACSLPMAYSGKNAALKKALGGSPIPKVPWKTMVRVTSGNKSLDAPVIDLGPAKWTGNALDLTIAAARYFDPKATANSFEAKVSYRILGGAQYA